MDGVVPHEQGAHHEAEVDLAREREADGEHRRRHPADAGEHDVERRPQRGVQGCEACRHANVAAERLQDGDQEDEQELDFEGFAHEGRYRGCDEHSHERARVWVYDSFSAARPKDAMGFGICPPHHARPAFTKCFLNMPRAM